MSEVAFRSLLAAQSLSAVCTPRRSKVHDRLYRKPTQGPFLDDDEIDGPPKAKAKSEGKKEEPARHAPPPQQQQQQQQQHYQPPPHQQQQRGDDFVFRPPPQTWMQSQQGQGTPSARTESAPAEPRSKLFKSQKSRGVSDLFMSDEELGLVGTAAPAPQPAASFGAAAVPPASAGFYQQPAGMGGGYPPPSYPPAYPPFFPGSYPPAYGFPAQVRLARPD